MLIKYTTKELDMLARLMRAEALSDGNLAMLMVGNVVVNRVLASCDLFNHKDTLYKIITMPSGGFVGYNSSLYQSSATSKEKGLAKRVLSGEFYYPATKALWFYAPGNNSCKSTWFNQPFVGRYKSHCFYKPKNGYCPEIA